MKVVAGLPAKTGAAYLLVFVVAIATYAALWRQAPVLDGDSPQYLEVARDLSDGRLDAVHTRTPGYPALLVLTGSTERPTRALFFVSLGLHMATIWLLACALETAGVGHGWLIAWCILLLLPPNVELAAYVMTENLSQFALAAGLSCLVLWTRSRRAAMLATSAVAFAFCGLVKPVYQVLAIAICAALLLVAAVSGPAVLRMRDAVRASLALIIVSTVVLGGLSWMNYRAFSFFGLTPSLGFHLSTKTMGFVERLPDDYGVVREILVRARDAELTKRGGTHSGSQAVWAAKDELETATGRSQPELSRYLVRMNLTLIRLAPLEYLQDVARSMATYWFPATGRLASLHSSVFRWTWTLLHFAAVGLLFLQLIVLTGVTIFDVMMRTAPERAAHRLIDTRATPAHVLLYALAGTIVFYTMILSCIIDIGEPRQRRATDVLWWLMIVVGLHVWRCCVAGRVARLTSDSGRRASARGAEST